MKEQRTSRGSSILPLLDREPWETMLLIADQCEDAGDVHLAAAWRWLSSRNKHPGKYRFWQWGKMPVAYHQVLPPGTWQLPDVAHAWLEARKQRIGRKYNQFDSCSEAFRVAAEAMASISQNGTDLEAIEPLPESNT